MKKNLAIRERLAAETDTVDARRNLAISYNRLGDISKAQGNLAEARTFYEKGLVIRERLAAETGTVEARRDLAISYNRLGDISKAQGNLLGAKALYKKGLAISERLAAELGTIEAYNDLAVSYYNMAAVANTVGKQQEYLRKAEAIWSRLATQSPDVRKFAELLAIVRQYIQ